MQPTLAAPPAARRILAGAETAEGFVTLSLHAAAPAPMPAPVRISLRGARRAADAIIAAARRGAADALAPASKAAPAWDGVERRSGLEDARLVIVERRQGAAA